MKRQLWLTTALIASIWSGQIKPIWAMTADVSLVPTRPENYQSCGWCGASCTVITPGQICPQVMPEPGAMCITNSNGACGILMSTVTLGPTSAQREVTPTPTVGSQVTSACVPVNGEVIVLPQGNTQAGCHNLNEAVDLADKNRRTIIKLLEGEYHPELNVLGPDGMLIQSPVTIVGAGRDKTKIILNDGKMISVNGETSYASQQDLIDKRVELSGLEVIGNIGWVPLVEVVDRVFYLQNARISNRSVDIGSVSLQLWQNTKFTYSAVYHNITNSEIGGGAGKAIKASFLDNSLGITINNSQVGIVEINGDVNYYKTKAAESKWGDLPMVWVKQSSVKSLKTNYTYTEGEYSIFGESEQAEPGFITGDAAVQLEHNDFMGGSEGIHIGVNEASRWNWVIKNNLIVNNKTNGVYMRFKPQTSTYLPVLEFKNNVVWNNGTNYYTASETGYGYLTDMTGQDGNMNSDPKLGGGWCLQPGSAAIGGGEGGLFVGAYGACACSNKVAGDTGCDGKAGLDDFAVWKNEYLKMVVSTRADFSGDGSVGLEDFAIWKKSFLMTN